MTNLATHGTGIAAAGAGAAPAPLYGDFLTTNGLWILSYAEIIQILGATYVACLLLQWLGVFKGIRKIYKLIRNR